MSYGDSYTETQDNIHGTLIKTCAPYEPQSIWRKDPTRVYYPAPVYLLGSRLPSADVRLIKQREKLTINTGQDVRFALHLHIWSRHRHGYLTGLPGCTTATVRRLAMRKPLF